MNELNQEIKTLRISVHESIDVSDNIMVEVIIVMVTVISGISFNSKEISNLREVLRASIGSSADEFTNNDLNEFGSSMLEATAIVLKAKYLQKDCPLGSINK